VPRVGTFGTYALVELELLIVHAPAPR